MCKVLMPIKPEYAYKILNGSKTYEYRKIKFKRKNVDSIVIYVTSPVMKIVGEVELINTLVDTPSKIWEKTNQSGGVNKQFYDKYYAGKTEAIAYVLGRVKKYRNEKSLLDFNIDYYPQSYVYLESVKD